MDAQLKVKLEQRAVAVLVVLFGVVLTGTLRSLGIFGRRPVGAATPASQRASSLAPTTLPSVVRAYQERLEPQMELPVATPVATEPQTTSYTAHALRNPLEPLLPRTPEPVVPAVSESPSPTPEWEMPAVQPPTLVVQGVWWGGTRPTAIINDEVYGVGDTVQGAVITAIGPVGVTVEFGGRTIQLVPTQESVNPWSPPGKPGAPLPSSFDSLRSLRTTPRRVGGDIPSEVPPAKAGARVEGSFSRGSAWR